MDVAVNTADLARVRFAVSPVTEAVWSTVALRKPRRRWLHRPWRDRVLPRVAGFDLLLAVTGGRRYLPDFLLPVPPGPRPRLAGELAAVAATDPARAVAEVRRVASPLPPVLERFVADPEAGLRRLVEQLADYVEVAVADDWPRLRALAEADVRYRSARIADHGVVELFADLHAEVRWHGGQLSTAVGTGDLGALAGRPAVLTPTAFAWPNASSSSELTGAWRLCYPPRAVGTLWPDSPAAPPPALRTLLGASRAAVLQALDAPNTTIQLAHLLGIAAATTSHHLTALRNAGLLTSERHGRLTVYARTPLGDHVIDACRPSTTR